VATIPFLREPGSPAFFARATGTQGACFSHRSLVLKVYPYPPLKKAIATGKALTRGCGS
jgi:hypothetical protein